MRSPEVMELMQRNPLAYVLAAVIAYRAQYRTGFNAHDLKIGEALLGDWKTYGMTMQQYRTAKRQLAEWGFATIRTTSKGTIASLSDTRLFDVMPLTPNNQNNKRVTSCQQADNEQLTTTENNENEKEHREQESTPAPNHKCKGSEQTDDQWLQSLSGDPTYSGIDVRREFGKMRAWCEARKVKPTRRRFVGWINRIEPPLQAGLSVNNASIVSTNFVPQ